jgi:hypothetical protein
MGAKRIQRSDFLLIAPFPMNKTGAQEFAMRGNAESLPLKSREDKRPSMVDYVLQRTPIRRIFPAPRIA